MSKRKIKKAHDDIIDHYEFLANKHGEKIGMYNFLYLIFFEAFKGLWTLAPSKKKALDLMMDAMNESENYHDEYESETTKTLN